MQDLNEVWRGVLKIIEQTMPRKVFVTWFQHTAPMSYENGVFVICFPNPFTKEWVEKRHTGQIFDALKMNFLDLTELKFVVEIGLANQDDLRKIELKDEPTKRTRRVSGGREVSFGDGLRSKALQEKYKLNSFITGPANRVPYAAAQAVAANPGGIYNPFFVYGKVGLGKTHLLQGTGNEILRNNPDAVVVYITSERFVNEVIESIRTRHMKEFKEKYRRVDCLIVDDIQFFSSKTTSQEEFFHTFNDLFDSGKQLIISSDRTPKELSDLDDRLTSRFGMGMVVEVQPPEYETRLAILQEKCMNEGIIIDGEVLSCIAYHIEESVRDLEGVLKSIIAAVKLQGLVPTVAMAMDTIKQLHKAVDVREDFVSSDHARPLHSGIPIVPVSVSAKNFIRNVDHLMTTVAKYFNISKQDLVGEDRRKEILLPRQICMYIIRKEMDEAYEKIGADFGGKNHTTVLHACHKIEKMLQTDQRIVRDLHAIKQELGLV